MRDRSNNVLPFRFNSLENEVRKRDEIISQLQKRIQELERLGLSGVPVAQPEEIESPETAAASDSGDGKPLSKNGSSGSEDISGTEEGFMVSLLRRQFVLFLIVCFAIVWQLKSIFHVSYKNLQIFLLAVFVAYFLYPKTYHFINN